MEEMSRENAREVEFRSGTLDECINELLNFKAAGKSVVINFSGHLLYSCDVTVDSAYQEVCGKTKAEYDKFLKEWKQNAEKMEKENKAKAEAKIPEWIKRGQRFIYPERAEEWKKCVEGCARGLYYGYELDVALDLMEKIENAASNEEIQEIMHGQGHSGASEGMVRKILLHFSKKGPEIYESTAFTELSDEEKEVVGEKRKENKLFESIHDSKDIKLNLLGAMGMTQSWLTFENLKTVLPPEQYQELENTVRSKAEQFYAKLNIKNATQEEIELAIEEDVDGQVFNVSVDDKGSFVLEEFELTSEKLTRPIDINQLDSTKLASVVEKAMQKHLDYNRFHSNRYLKEEEIPQFLKDYIHIAKEYQERHVEPTEEHVAGEFEGTTDERQADEKEIVDLLSQKNQLKLEISGIEQQLANLRAEEAKLKKSLEEKQTQLNSFEEK